MDPAACASLLLAAYAGCLWVSLGVYHPAAMLVTFAAFVLLATVWFGEVEPATRPARAERMVAGVFALSLALVIYNPMLRAYTDTWAALAMRGFLWLAAAGFGVFWLRGRGFAFTLFCLAQAHFLVLVVDPSPAIDVWVFYQKASAHFFAGLNPYLQTDYPDLYRGRYDYPPGLHYPPASLYVLAPCWRLWGDVRVGLWLAHLGSALLLCRLAREPRLGRLAALTWMAFPSTFPVLEQSYTDGLLGFWLLASLVAGLAGRPRTAALCFGVALATKQTAVVAAVVALAWLQRRHLGAVALAALTAGLLILPYALWDWPSFWASNTQIWRNQVRLDSFSLVALAANVYEVDIAPWHTLLVYLGILPLVAWRATRSPAPRDCVGGVCVLLALVFYFGKQAFLNYFDLISLGLLAWILLAVKR